MWSIFKGFVIVSHKFSIFPPPSRNQISSPSLLLNKLFGQNFHKNILIPSAALVQGLLGNPKHRYYSNSTQDNNTNNQDNNNNTTTNENNSEEVGVKLGSINDQSDLAPADRYVEKQQFCLFVCCCCLLFGWI